MFVLHPWRLRTQAILVLELKAHFFGLGLSWSNRTSRPCYWCFHHWNELVNELESQQMFVLHTLRLKTQAIFVLELKAHFFLFGLSRTKRTSRPTCWCFHDWNELVNEWESQQMFVLHPWRLKTQAILVLELKAHFFGLGLSWTNWTSRPSCWCFHDWTELV